VYKFETRFLSVMAVTASTACPYRRGAVRLWCLNQKSIQNWNGSI